MNYSYKTKERSLTLEYILAKRADKEEAAKRLAKYKVTYAEKDKLSAATVLNRLLKSTPQREVISIVPTSTVKEI